MTTEPYGIRTSFAPTMFFGLRTPRVGRGAVVALDDEAVDGVAADDPVDHLQSGHRVALRHLVGDHLADVVARLAPTSTRSPVW